MSQTHIITLSVFSLPWDLHSQGGLGSSSRMLKEFNKCFRVGVHLSWAHEHYPPKQKESHSYFSFAGKDMERHFPSVFSSPIAFWSRLLPKPCRSWWPEPPTQYADQIACPDSGQKTRSSLANARAYIWFHSLEGPC